MSAAGSGVWHCHAHAPWNDVGLVDLEGSRCRKSGCLQMDLQSPYLPYCQGNRAVELSHPEQEDCTWRLWWSHQLFTCARPKGQLSLCPPAQVGPPCQECPTFLPFSILVLPGFPRPSEGAFLPASFSAYCEPALSGVSQSSPCLPLCLCVLHGLVCGWLLFFTHFLNLGARTETWATLLS